MFEGLTSFIHCSSYLYFLTSETRRKTVGFCRLPYEIVGGYTWCETPVPIPNTEAKALGPMVVRERESRSLPTLNNDSPAVKTVGLFL